MPLSITLTTPPHDTPAHYSLEAGQHVLARESSLAEAEAVSELLEDLVWQRHYRRQTGVTPCP
jgi:hypothetical protein